MDNFRARFGAKMASGAIRTVTAGLARKFCEFYAMLCWKSMEECSKRDFFTIFQKFRPILSGRGTTPTPSVSRFQGKISQKSWKIKEILPGQQNSLKLPMKNKEKQAEIIKTTRRRLRRRPKGAGASPPPPWVLLFLLFLLPFLVFCLPGFCFLAAFSCQNGLQIGLGPWALERSDWTRGGSGGRQPSRWLKITPWRQKDPKQHLYKI